MTKHRWNYETERRLAGIDTADGNDRNERDCLHCGITRVTVIPPHGRSAWHEWRTKTGGIYLGEMTPPCVNAVAAELREALPK